MKKFFIYFFLSLILISIVTVFYFRIFVTGEKLIKDINHENESRFLSGNKTVCILVHGFASGAQETKYLAEYLHGKGYSVSALLLKGHNQRPKDLKDVKWKEWEKQLNFELQRLIEQKYENIYVIGFSMGGLLALRVSTNKQIKGIVAISPSLYIFSKKFYLFPLTAIVKSISCFIPYMLRRTDLNFIYNAQQNRRIIYDEIPLATIHQVLLLADSTASTLKNLRTPLLVIQAKDDKTVDFLSSKTIHASVKSINKDYFELPTGGHLIILNDQRDAVFEKIRQFIETK